jgi:hypothetical protein
MVAVISRLRKRTGSIRIGDIAAAVALGVFLWRALIPAGYMPDPETGFIKLCSAQGLVTGTGDKAPGDDNNPDHLGAMCVFAAAPAMAPPLALEFEVSAPTQWRFIPTLRVAAQRARDGPLRTQSARAPPFHS